MSTYVGALALLAAASMTTGAARAIEPVDFTTIESSVRQEMSTRSIPSIAISVARDGRIVYERAFGYANIERQTLATVDTAYRVASVTKPFTATALMVLRQRGEVDIDGPAERYMGGLHFQRGSGVVSTVTLRQLLNHSSGLAPYFQFVFGPSAEAASTFETAFERYGLLVHPPGQLFDYSNMGFALLGDIIGKVTRKPYARAMRDVLFRPLGMNHTFVDSLDRPAAEIATGYDAQLKPLPVLYNDTPGGGNAYSSVHDLALFGMFHLDAGVAQHPILSKENVSLMSSYIDPETFYSYYDGTHYALGWFVREDEGGYKTVWHEGGMPGASAIIKMAPAAHIVVSIVTNAGDKNTFIESVANRILTTMLPAFRPDSVNMTAHYKVYSDDSNYRGEWRGTIYVKRQALPCSLIFTSTGEIKISYGSVATESGETETTFRGLVNKDSFLAAFDGMLPSDDLATVPPSKLVMHLLRQGNTLSGRINAYSTATETLQYFYPYFIRLERSAPLGEETQ